LSFKVFYEKFMTARTMGGKHVEIFVNPSKAEIMYAIKRDDHNEVKLFYEISSGNMYLQSSAIPEHQDVADELGVRHEDMMHIFINPKHRAIHYYNIASEEGDWDLPEEDWDNFETDVLPRIERMFPGFSTMRH
jgi:hypothetical protein